MEGDGRVYDPHANMAFVDEIDIPHNAPHGGAIVGHGILVRWQRGPTNVEGRNGAFVEDIIYAAIHRLQFFQQSRYNHEENARAIRMLEEALDALDRRTRQRLDRGVYGTHQV